MLLSDRKNPLQMKPLRVSTGPEQGFPCKFFPNKEKPVFTGIPTNQNRFFPVGKNLQGKRCFFITGMGLQCRFLEPNFSNQISRTRFLEPLFYTFLEKWLQVKWCFVYFCTFNSFGNWGRKEMLEKKSVYVVGRKAEMCLLIGIGCHKIYGVHKSTIVVGFHIGSFLRKLCGLSMINYPETCWKPPKGDRVGFLQVSDFFQKKILVKKIWKPAGNS
jgi:hypothetical protein